MVKRHAEGLTHRMYRFVEWLYNTYTITGRRDCEFSIILRCCIFWISMMKNTIAGWLRAEKRAA
ncbi:MAG: hypothetical protein QXS68_08365 [Candidatus Methanomethylicaceae archaeon]